jgi:hydroxyacid-oxoacid transhydrogenase
MTYESIIVMQTSTIKYGFGATWEIGYEMKRLGSRHVMLVADPNLVNRDPVKIAMDSLQAADINFVLYSDVHIEPTDRSFQEAILSAKGGNFDGYVAVGGGSTMDTAKVANLYATHPADFFTYVNPPIGEGQPPPGPIKPMIAIPTTAGTGSETTGTAIFDYQDEHVKTGIAHQVLRPVMGIIDPNNTRSLPMMVAASTGFDVLCHAIESLTAIPYHQLPAPQNPGLRPPYQGANPISDVWAARAIQMVAQNIIQSLQDPENDDARAEMILASTFAGIGFGNAGVHLPHAMSYPIAGMVRDYFPEGYAVDQPLIPHGLAVLLTSPAVYRFTASLDPKIHLYIAQLMGEDVSGARTEDAGEILATAMINLMRKAGMPNGLKAIGYSPADIPQMVTGTLAQQRLTKLSPLAINESILTTLFSDSMEYW